MQLLNIRTITGAALLAAALVIPTAATAATDIFLEFKAPSSGPVPVGESTNAAFKDWIDVSSYDWGVENVINFGSRTGGGGAGKVAFSELNLTKSVDKSSSTLLAASCAGTYYADATLVLTRLVGSKQSEYLRLEMKNVFVSKTSISVAADDDRAMETVTLVFGSMRSIYTPYDATGKEGTKIEAKWSVITNKAELRPADEAKADPVPPSSPPASTGTKITVK